jgi:hypothetical protein
MHLPAKHRADFETTLFGWYPGPAEAPIRKADQQTRFSYAGKRHSAIGYICKRRRRSTVAASPGEGHSRKGAHQKTWTGASVRLLGRPGALTAAIVRNPLHPARPAKPQT